MKRICIYVTYDKENIVDAYIGYILSEISKNTDKLVVVCNESSVEKGLDNILPYTNDIFFRENIGYDAGAFKDALCEFIGWDEIEKYEELLLINDSFFGPFVPLELILDEMEQREVDFWGLITHAEAYNQNMGHIPEHIQSYFVAVQTKMLHNTSFKDYWEQMPYYRTFDEVVRNHEIKFTEYFSKKGFTYSSLADSGINDSKILENNYPQYASLSYELIRKRKFPILKKQQLAYQVLYLQTQENYLRAIRYIEKNTNYDVNLIWDNIIRTLDVSDLYRNLHLLYIIDELQRKRNNTVKKRDAVIVVNVSHISACEKVLEYLLPIQSNKRLEILIYPGCKELSEIYLAKNFKILDIKTEMTELIDIILKFEYICFISDEELSSDFRPNYIGKSHFFNIWENLIGENDYIDQVLMLLDKEERIGILFPPESNFGIYFGEKTDWNDRYDRIRKIIDKHTIKCICTKEKCPFSISKNLWIKKDVLKRLSELTIDEMKSIEYLWIYLAQEQELLSGTVESAEYASMNEINMKFYLDDIIRQVQKQYGRVQIYPDLKEHIFLGAVMRFCSQNKKIYVYGIGYMARKYLPYIPRVDAYIVSNGQHNPGEFNEKKVYYLSEISDVEEIGVVVCLDKKYQEEVKSMLQKKGIKNYICI